MKAAVWALAAAAAVASAQKDCTPVIKQADGKYYKYNLKPLNHAPGDIDIFTTRDDQGNYYYVNFCGPMSQQCTSSASVCKATMAWVYVDVGMSDTQQWSDSPDVAPGKGIKVTYSNGEDCDQVSNAVVEGGRNCTGPNAKNRAIITLNCDPNVPEGYFDTVTQNGCDYVFTFRTMHACGEVAGHADIHITIDLGEVFAIVILVLILVSVVLYFGLGALYQMKFKNAQTPGEYIIHSEFWLSLPGLVVDGCKFIAHGFRKGDYVSV